MSEIIERLKREKLLKQIDEKDMLTHEFNVESPKDSLGITLNVLAECERKSQVSIINRKVYKVACYFVNNLKNIKLKPLESERQFDWQVVFVEAESRFSTKSLVIAVTEHDIRELVG